MKKVLMILLTILLLTGCNKDDEYYKKVSDTVVSFYRSSNYKRSDFSSKDANALDKYLSNLTHKNQEIDITKYVNESIVETTKSNTRGIYTKGNNWFIKYDDLKFVSNNDIEPYAVINCNGKTFTLSSSMFYPDYSETKSNRLYSYVYVGEKIEDDSRKYAYRSSYDGSGLIVNLELNGNDISNINTNFENVNNFVSTNNSSDTGGIFRIVFIILIIVAGSFSIYKLYKNNRANF